MIRLLKKLIKIVVIIVLICVVVFACARLPLGPITKVAKAAETEIMLIFDKNATTKKLANQLLEAEVDALASAADITREQAQKMISNIDIAGWKTMDLPADAVPIKQIHGLRENSGNVITLYSDHSYLTIDSNGKAVTLSVPEGARNTVKYLYLIGN